MNYCNRCESYYAKPGTCNCFAPTQAAPAITPQIVPYVPSPTIVPWWIPNPVTPMITWGTAETTGTSFVVSASEMDRMRERGQLSFTGSSITARFES